MSWLCLTGCNAGLLKAACRYIEPAPCEPLSSSVNLTVIEPLIPWEFPDMGIFFISLSHSQAWCPCAFPTATTDSEEQRVYNHTHTLLSFPYPIGLEEQMAVKSHSHVTARSTRRRRKPCQCARRNQSLCSNPRRQHRALLGTGENWVTKHFLFSPGFVNVPLSSFKRPYSIFMNRRHLLVSLRQCGWKDGGGASSEVGESNHTPFCGVGVAWEFVHRIVFVLIFSFSENCF